ncbi:MAG TPA: preprotein translocase subunit YajC [Clostridia bacterium]|nr:preprotein translocase subunit YajC [Clostridia bacterium]
MEGLGQWGGTIIYLAVFFGIIYFLMIRPQQKQQKQRMEMLNSVKVNDRIVTIGGMHGRITKIKDDVITVRIADKVEVEMEKQAIGRVISNKDS